MYSFALALGHTGPMIAMVANSALLEVLAARTSSEMVLP